MENKNPLSPHIQIYNWHISSLVSICHRITGIVNIIIITLICFWVALLLLGDSNYELMMNYTELLTPTAQLAKNVNHKTYESFVESILNQIQIASNSNLKWSDD